MFLSHLYIATHRYQININAFWAAAVMASFISKVVLVDGAIKKNQNQLSVA
jgi:hypothetical protein